MCFSIIFIVLYIFINYPPDLSPPLRASVIPLPDEVNVGNLGKLPPSLIPAEVVPEPEIEVRIYLKAVRP